MTELRPTAFIIKSGGSYLCPVCGYDGTFSGDHYDDAEGGCIGSGICSCCFFEPGFDDNPLASAEAEASIEASIASYRASWIAAGLPWRGGDVKAQPPGWNPQEQLARLFREAPFLKPT